MSDRQQASEADAPQASGPPEGSPGAAPLSAHHRAALDRFIVFWGEMASNWGINRTMAQIFALLYASEEPLDTDEIMERLQISRGNANMNLRSLLDWNLVRKVPIEGSRKDHYTAEKDVWAITAQIIRERERREIQPVIEQLEECRTALAGAAPLTERERTFQERIDNLLGLMEVFEGFSRAFLPVVQQRNGALLRQLIASAAALQPADITEDVEDEP